MFWVALVLVSALATAVALGGSVALAAAEARFKSGLGGASGLLAGVLAAALTLQLLVAAPALANGSTDDPPSAADRPPAPNPLAPDASRALVADPAPVAADPPQEAAEALPPADEQAETPRAPEAAETAIVEAELDSDNAQPALLQAEAKPLAAAATADTPTPLRSPLLEDAAPPERPEWVYVDPFERDGKLWIPVSSGGPSTPESQAALDSRIEKVVSDYLVDYLGSARASRFVHFSPDQLRQRLVQPEKLVYVKNGSVTEAHALLCIDDAFRHEVDQQWDAAVAQSRLWQTAAAAAGLMLLVSMAFGYFRLDAATKGYYSGRLQLAVSAAILALLAGGYLFANQQAFWELWDWVL